MALKLHMVIAGSNLFIAQYRDVLQYVHTRGASIMPRLKRLEVGDHVYCCNATARTTFDPAGDGGANTA